MSGEYYAGNYLALDLVNELNEWRQRESIKMMSKEGHGGFQYEEMNEPA